LPLLDVTQVLSDPDFYSAFYVTQSMQAVQMSGATPGAVTVTPGSTTLCRGVVEKGKQSRLLAADGARITAFIEIWTQAPISGGYKIDDTTSRRPDVITYAGNQWLVVIVNDYTDWGNGFVYVQADLLTVNMVANVPDPVGSPT
jgi:hypothetical protein